MHTPNFHSDLPAASLCSPVPHGGLPEAQKSIRSSLLRTCRAVKSFWNMSHYSSLAAHDDGNSAFLVSACPFSFNLIFSPALFKCKKWQVSRVANHSYLQFDDVGFTLMWPQWVWESISSLYGRSLWLCCLPCLHFPRAFQCNSDTPAAWSFFLVFLILLGQNSVMK